MQLDPKLGLAYTALARLHSVLLQRTEAEEAYERAVELSPNDPALLTQYSRFKSFTEQYEEAIQLARRAALLDPGSPDVGQTGDAYFLAGDLDGAASAYADYLELNPASFSTHHRLGEVEAARGNHESAQAHLQLWEQSMSPNFVHPGRGPRAAFAYSLIGRTDAAVRIGTQVLEDYPTLAPSRAALAHLAIGNRGDALDLFREAAESGDSIGDTLVYFVKRNVWGAPVLNEPEFVEVRSRLGFRE